jgi:hypothetical protein
MTTNTMKNLSVAKHGTFVLKILIKGHLNYSDHNKLLAYRDIVAEQTTNARLPYRVRMDIDGRAYA